MVLIGILILRKTKKTRKTRNKVSEFKATEGSSTLPDLQIINHLKNNNYEERLFGFGGNSIFAICFSLFVRVLYVLSRGTEVGGLPQVCQLYGADQRTI